MVRFKFEIGSAFLNYLHRPITVPRSQVDYEAFEAENFDSDDLRIICPHGQIMSGRMIYSKAGYGPYYQIRIERSQNDELGRLPIGKRLIVEIEKIGKAVEVRLTLHN